VLVLALVMSLSLVGASWARPFGMGQRGCWGATPEQAGQLFDLRQKFMNDNAPLRRDMAVKRAELRALWRAENPDLDKIRAKQKELNALRDQFQEKALTFKLEMKKLCPKGGRGMGPRADMGGDGNMGGGMMDLAMELPGGDM
jgi:zinc resistance-associated protein